MYNYKQLKNLYKGISYTLMVNKSLEMIFKEDGLTILNYCLYVNFIKPYIDEDIINSNELYFKEIKEYMYECINKYQNLSDPNIVRNIYKINLLINEIIHYLFNDEISNERLKEVVDQINILSSSIFNEDYINDIELLNEEFNTSNKR